MESNNFGTAAEREGHMPGSTIRLLLRNRSNLFCINTAIDHHTIMSSSAATNVISGSRGHARERGFIDLKLRVTFSSNSIFLNNVFICDGFNNLSLGCLAASGYSIRLSNNDSYVSINSQRALKFHFIDSFWIADVNPPKPEGFVKNVASASNSLFLQILEQDRIQAMVKSEGASVLKMNRFWHQQRILKERKFKNQKASQLRGAGAAWVLNSNCSVHTTNKKEHLANLRSWRDSLGRERWVGDYKLGNFVLKDVNYCPQDLSNFVSLNILAQQRFDIHLTNSYASITKGDELYLTVPKVGKFWIANSLHQQKGWLYKGCPYEREYGEYYAKKFNTFSPLEISNTISQLRHICDLEGPLRPPEGLHAIPKI